MAQMALPTQAQKNKQVEKAERHYNSLKARFDAAKTVIAEVEPGLRQAEQYLTYLRQMPVVDAPAEQPADTQPAEQSLFSEQHDGEQAFV